MENTNLPWKTRSVLTVFENVFKCIHFERIFSRITIREHKTIIAAKNYDGGFYDWFQMCGRTPLTGEK